MNTGTGGSRIGRNPAHAGKGEDAAVLYEYRIVELGVGEGALASYRVEYTQERGEEKNGTPT